MNHYDNDRMMNLRSNLLDYAFSLTSDHALAHQLVDESTARAFDGESVTEDDAELRGRVIRLMHAIYDRKYSRLAGCINDNVECYDADIYSINLTSGCDGEIEGVVSGEEITHVFNSLSDRYRVTAMMHFVGYTHDEIASVMGMSASDVADRLTYCRMWLRAVLTV